MVTKLDVVKCIRHLMPIFVSIFMIFTKFYLVCKTTLTQIKLPHSRGESLSHALSLTSMVEVIILGLGRKSKDFNIFLSTIGLFFLSDYIFPLIYSPQQ